MARGGGWIAAYVLGLELLLSPAATAGSRSASLTLTPDGLLLIVVNSDSRSVSILATSSRQKLAEISVGDNPQTVTTDATGTTAYVTNRGDDSLSVVDLVAFEQRAVLAVADEPFGVVAAADGILYVSCQGAALVEVVDPALTTTIARIPTETNPRGLALAPDGSELYVTHFTSGRLSVIDTSTRIVEEVITTGLDTNLSQGIWVNGAGHLAYLPQTRANVGNPAPVFDSTVFPVVSVVDLMTRQHLPTQRIHLDLADEPVNLPIGLALTATGILYVLNAGSNDLSVIDLATGSAIAHLEVGDNPRGLALSPDESTLYVGNSLSGSVSTVDTASSSVVGEIAATDIPLPPAILNGKRLFNSSDRPELSRNQWISCATCHFDGESNGRTWLFADGPRNVPSLLGVGRTLPVHWSGDFDELQDVESSIRNLQGGTGLAPGPDNCYPACDQAPPNAGRSPELDDLAAYLRSLRLPPSPNLEPDGSLGPAAARGQTLFASEELRCGYCHPPPHFTDRQRHDVGTATSPLETKGPAFDVPSLHGLYKSAPYLHDGTAATLLDVLTTFNPEDRHGLTSHLTAEELADLVAFLEALPFTAEVFVDGFESGDTRLWLAHVEGSGLESQPKIPSTTASRASTN